MFKYRLLKLRQAQKTRGYAITKENKNTQLEEDSFIEKSHTCEAILKEDLKVAVCGIGKLENHYIREWVEHYKNIGVDNIILIDNNDPDGERYEEVIQDYIDSGFVILEDYRGRKGTFEWRSNFTSIQIEAYNDVYQKYGDRFHWIGFFDIDEFVMMETDVKVKDVLCQSRFNNFDVIQINHKHYDDNDLLCVENNNYSVVTRFTRPATKDKWRNSYCKSWVRTQRSLVINSAHGFDPLHQKYSKKIKACNILGVAQRRVNLKLTNTPKVIHKVMWLNHYRTKTIQEFIEQKILRGWPDDLGKTLHLDLKNFFGSNKDTKEKREIAFKILINTPVFVIGNDCTAAKIYEILNQPFNHPFVWCGMLHKDYLLFLDNFYKKTIDLNNITKVETYDTHPLFSKYYQETNLKYYLNIDNIFNVGYSHYIESDCEKVDNWKHYVINCKDFVRNKYLTRVKRMLGINEPLKYVLYNEKTWTTLDEELEFIKLDIPAHKFIYTSHKELIKYNSDNITVLYHKKIDYDTSFKTLANEVITYLTKQ